MSEHTKPPRLSTEFPFRLHDEGPRAKVYLNDSRIFSVNEKILPEAHS